MTLRRTIERKRFGCPKTAQMFKRPLSKTHNFFCLTKRDPPSQIAGWFNPEPILRGCSQSSRPRSWRTTRRWFVEFGNVGGGTGEGEDAVRRKLRLPRHHNGV